ncbi:hypothetical protein GJAV_G00129320 [Gymnothorax javanicus]|nr:hypothetical protein GJAV_G00129320 [Gymnothorax javanicus]
MEWLDYGHKFGDRCGHQENGDDVSEQCPVFLQWLDCVHQLLKQFPCLFEFNEAFLVKLVQHTYSCLYGTFLCNNAKEREAHHIYERTCSVWSLLCSANKNFQNLLYIPSHDMVLQPVCHTRALQLWTAVYLPTSSPCTAAEDSMGLNLSPSTQREELMARSLDRLPKTRSMDNLVFTCENGVTLTRTSSDPNLNKHCLEDRPALEHVPGLGRGVPGNPGDVSSETDEYNGCFGVETVSQVPTTHREEDDSSRENCFMLKQPCLTTQPLPFLQCASPLEQARPDSILPPASFLPISLRVEVESQTADLAPSTNAHILTICNSPTTGSRDSPLAPPTAMELLTFRNRTPAPQTEVSSDMPTEMRAKLWYIEGVQDKEPEEDEQEEEPELQADHPQLEAGRMGQRQGCHSQMSEFSLQGPHWVSEQGLVKSACEAFQPGTRGRCITGQLLHEQGLGHCCRLDSARPECSPVHANRPSAAVWSSALYSSRAPAALVPSSPPPTAPAYLNDDGLPVAMDAVQQRLRQIEARYKQEVEILRRQLRQLQMRLESKQHCSPPSEPDVDHEDNIQTCLRESDDSDEEDSVSDRSEDRFSEGSWDRVEQMDTEVTRWVPDHMASHCFSCDSEFWIVKRRHHCRNCGNVFCKDCCHLKLPIPDQQLYDPVLVCNSCHDLLLESRTREIRSQQLKKPIATASS